MYHIQLELCHSELIAAFATFGKVGQLAESYITPIWTSLRSVLHKVPIQLSDSV